MNERTNALGSHRAAVGASVLDFEEVTLADAAQRTARRNQVAAFADVADHVVPAAFVRSLRVSKHTYTPTHTRTLSPTHTLTHSLTHQVLVSIGSTDRKQPTKTHLKTGSASSSSSSSAPPRRWWLDRLTMWWYLFVQENKSYHDHDDGDICEEDDDHITTLTMMICAIEMIIIPRR